MSSNRRRSPRPKNQAAGRSQEGRALAKTECPSPDEPISGRAELAAAKLSDVGRLRPHNEDFVDCYVPADPEQLERKGAVYLVADGMGGHQAGEVASQGAVETVIRQYYADLDHDVATSLVRAFRQANQYIHEQAQTDPNRTGMGTTLVAAVILGRKVYIANVGDSRAYLISKTGISQITEDHSWVEEQVRAGLLTTEQARRHPQRNLVTRALGSRPAVEVDLFEGQLGEGDKLLLCSDGLTSHVEDLEMEAVVREHPPEEAVRLLVAKANERGGSDNISVLVVGGREEVVPAPVPSQEPSREFPLIPVLAGAAVVLALVAAALLFLPSLLKSDATPTPTASPAVAQTATAPAPEGASPSETTAGETPPAASETAPPLGATLTPASGAGPTTEESTPSPTETLVPTSTATMLMLTPVIEGTSTDDAPTEGSPTAGAPTEGTPTDGATSTAAPTPTSPPAVAATPTSHPAPTLLRPDANAELRETGNFAWQWPHGSLPANHFFDLRIWSQQEEEGGLPRRGAVQPTTRTEAVVQLALVPAIKDHGTGDYYWSVVVVQNAQNPRVVGSWGEKRKFHYAGPEERDSGPRFPFPVPTLRP
jgi:serine/threonine protein phosphatase PrpC